MFWNCDNVLNVKKDNNGFLNSIYLSMEGLPKLDRGYIQSELYSRAVTRASLIRE